MVIFALLAINMLTVGIIYVLWCNSCGNSCVLCNCGNVDQKTKIFYDD